MKALSLYVMESLNHVGIVENSQIGLTRVLVQDCVARDVKELNGLNIGETHMARKLRCPVCNGCMDFIYVDLKRYIFCGFCHTYRQGPNDNLQIVESPYKDRIENSRKIDDPVLEENNEEEIS